MFIFGSTYETTKTHRLESYSCRSWARHGLDMGSSHRSCGSCMVHGACVEQSKIPLVPSFCVEFFNLSMCICSKVARSVCICSIYTEKLLEKLFRLSQTIMESFNRREHVIAAFLDVEKAFDNVWHNGLSLICPPSYVDGSLTF